MKIELLTKFDMSNFQSPDFLKKTLDNKPEEKPSKFEIPISTKFTFDEDTKTLITKVKRGDVLNQFPSDDFLRMKKYFMDKI